MHFTSFFAMSSFLISVVTADSHLSGEVHHNLRRHRSNCHRRHHAKLNSTSLASATDPALNRQGGGGGSSWSSHTSHARTSTSTSAVASPTSQSSSNPSSSSTSTIGWGLIGVAMNGITVGFLPDDGSGGGTAESISDITNSFGVSIGPQGYYAQAQSGTLFDGSQLTSKMDSIKANGGVFQPAVMPTGGWWGLTSSDNQQAVAICQVMKQFTDAGLEVWLRFAHEVNWYQQDGTYQGTASDFKEGWATVAAACRQYAPGVKMWFTPNVQDMATYESYFPDDINDVDLIGIDFYPTNPGSTAFVDTMQAFHDKYTSDTVKFAIGEFGLGAAASISDRLAYLQQASSSATAAALPNYISCSWFNYQKGYNFKIANTNGDSITAAYLKV